MFKADKMILQQGMSTTRFFNPSEARGNIPVEVRLGSQAKPAGQRTRKQNTQHCIQQAMRFNKYHQEA
jgi:hypothetical protein